MIRMVKYCLCASSDAESLSATQTQEASLETNLRMRWSTDAA